MNVLVLVTDKGYASKTFETIRQVRGPGKYSGDIVIIAHPELQTHSRFIDDCMKYSVTPAFFPVLDVSEIVEKIKASPFTHTDGRELKKLFQWQKLQVFNTYFRKWKTVVYIDAGMHIFDDINIFFTISRPGTLLAHCDDYPDFSNRLVNQFDTKAYPSAFCELAKNYNLETQTYQTTALVFQTDLIHDTTVNDILDLAKKYPISRTNEQGIMNIYFYGRIGQIPIWRDGKFMYDFWERFGFNWSSYRMLKYPRTLSSSGSS